MTAGSIPAELRYAKTHEWARLEGSRATVGITDHAQSELTDIVFVDLPAVGKEARAGEVLLQLESVKTVADVYAPGSGKVVEVNPELKAHPELVNKEPYGRGWLVRIELAQGLATGLLDAAGYRRILESPSP
jgi:glycine cleavage system H protein